MKKNKTDITPLERSSHHLGAMKKHIVRMRLKPDPNFQTGFTLVELMITMVVFVLAIAAASQIFTGLLTQFKQQSKISETNIERIIGLDILRRDIEHAGYGLPWNGLITYSESSANPFSLNDAPSSAPRAIISQDSATYSSPNDIFDGSDYLVIKSVNVARNDTCEKWTYLKFYSPYTTTWTTQSENLDSTDRVIVISPGNTELMRHTLVVNGTDFYTTYNDVTTSAWLPSSNIDTRIVYGINDSSSNLPVRPFNRADYFIQIPTTMPQQCAIGTGILYKATMDHDTGGTLNYLPLLDCAADMQVVYGIDTNATLDDEVNCYADDLSSVFVLSPVDAENIRNRVIEVRVYILAHEGQIDRAFSFTPPISPSSIQVGENLPSSSGILNCNTGGSSVGRTFDFDLIGITDWENYRWKVYTIAVKPKNMR